MSDVNGTSSRFTYAERLGNRVHIYIFYEVYIYPILFHDQDVTQGQFSSWLQLVWIHNFSSLKLFVIRRLKSPACPTIYS